MLNNKTILITGGTGAFGQKFLSLVFEKYQPKKVIIYSRDENKQCKMKEELKDKVDMSKVRFFIGDVRDKERLYRAFHGVDYVVHAAVMKQVPVCEYNPFEAIKTNIHGAQNVIDAALDCGVKRVVALSSVKAVNPVNLYGGTKLVSDKLFIAGNAYKGTNGTIFSVVRYGNVAGQAESVIPVLRKAIDEGKTELPITDQRMTRFLLTMEQAVELVFKALSESKGGETYIAKSASFHLVDIAHAMKPDAPIKEIGLRDGEKLHETLITKEDSRYTYDYDKYYIIYPNFEWWNTDQYLTEGGKLVEEGFEYCSDKNTEWLTSEQLKSMLPNL